MLLLHISSLYSNHVAFTCCETETAPSFRNSFSRMLGAIKRLNQEKGKITL